MPACFGKRPAPTTNAPVDADKAPLAKKPRAKKEPAKKLTAANKKPPAANKKPLASRKSAATNVLAEVPAVKRPAKPKVQFH